MLYFGHCWSPTPSRQPLFETSEEKVSAERQFYYHSPQNVYKLFPLPFFCIFWVNFYGNSLRPPFFLVRKSSTRNQLTSPDRCGVFLFLWGRGAGKYFFVIFTKLIPRRIFLYCKNCGVDGNQQKPHVRKMFRPQIRARHGGVEKEGVETLMNDTPLPKTWGFGPPLVRYVFHPPQVAVLCFSCTKNHDRADQKLFWRGPIIFGRVHSLVRLPPPIRFAPPHITAQAILGPDMAAPLLWRLRPLVLSTFLVFGGVWGFRKTFRYL